MQYAPSTAPFGPAGELGGEDGAGGLPAPPRLDYLDQRGLRRRSAAFLSQVLPRDAKFKTEICHNYSVLGSCKWRDQCFFAHGVEELREGESANARFKLKPCSKFHSQACCSYGQRCQYIHQFTYAQCLKCFLDRACAALAETPPPSLNLLLARAQLSHPPLSIFRRLKHLL